MKSFLALFLILSPAAASLCGQVQTCFECDSVSDNNGTQLCSWCDQSSSCVAYLGLECVFGTKITVASDCPVPVRSGYEYDDAFARNVMFPLSCAAYSNNPQECLTNVVHGAKMIHQFTVPCDSVKDDTCSAFTAVSDYHKANIISFRGTDGNVQLILESLESVFSHMTDMTGGGKVSSYFYNGFVALWNNGILSDLQSMLQENPEYELWLTGHSLGGSIANIAANYIAIMGIFPKDKIKIMTFGQPRTGNREFSIVHNDLIPYTYRVVHRKDFVPHVPSEDYRGYHHHRYEVWYNNDMNQGDPYTVCLSPEDPKCSDSYLIDLPSSDHGHYFGKPVSDSGEDGCVNW